MYDFAGPIVARVPLPNGDFVTLEFSRPNWMEADKMSRMLRLHNLKLRHAFTQDQNGHEQQAHEIQEQVDRVQLDMAEFAADDVLKHVRRFVDRDAAGNALFMENGQPLLCEEGKPWKEGLKRLINANLFPLWESFVRRIAPTNHEIEFTNELVKN